MKLHRWKNLRWLLAGTGLLCAALPAGAADERALLEDARQCTEETRRLERLACFDQVFRTPLAEAKGQIQQTLRPESWRQAYRQEEQRQPGEGPVYRDTGELAGHLVTIPALGTRPPRPLLAVQCHNNITELSLLVPSALGKERIRLEFEGSQEAGPGLWRVRDDGFVVSAGRGLPSIRKARRLAALESTQLGSDSGQLDGLMFDLAGLAGAMRPLRKSCGW